MTAYLPWKPTERTPAEWDEWIAAFKKRNGLAAPLPAPPDDAPTPPKPRVEVDDERGNEETER